MNLFKRLSTTITSNFDWAISQIENHEQLIQTAIKDVQSSATKARLQLVRVNEDGKKMAARISSLQQEITSWESRAREHAKDDRATALECLKRKQKAEAALTSLVEQHREHQTIEARLNADLGRIADQLEALKRKKNTYAARQLRAHAVNLTASEDLLAISEVTDIFDRWDMKIAECETLITPLDTFAENFANQEQAAALEAELNALIATETK